MGTATMGKVIVSAKIENLNDQYMAHKGLLPPDQVRTLTVDDALVDTGAAGLMVPTRLLMPLGLRRTFTKQAKTVGGPITTQMYEAVRLTIQRRSCVVKVHEIPDYSPVLIGPIPLEALDWVVDSKGMRLIGNPGHGGQHMAEAF